MPGNPRNQTQHIDIAEWTPRIVTAAILSASVIALSGCASGSLLADDREAVAVLEERTAPLQVMSIEIPGAAYAFEMVLVPGDKASGIKSFWVGRTEVTWEAFDAFVYPAEEEASGVDAVTRPSKPYLPPDRGFGHEGFAAISMSHRNATAFCVWLSTATGKRFRLPQESEWEWACRAGDGDRQEETAVLSERAWFVENADGSPKPVGTRKPNAWGLHDMLGNVAEWCDGEDGKPITKGGSYRDAAEQVRIEARTPQEASWNASDPQIPKSPWWLADGPFVGFRVVCEVEDESGPGQGDDAR